jgi:DHA3 family macrolide efflux protein-like MFS transporter
LGAAQGSRPGGMKVFALIWLGQLVSIVGSGLTSFALGVWVYQSTGLATPYTLILFFFALPNVLSSLLAGPLVDRWDRRKVMILSDTGAGISTLAIALLLLWGRLEIWHIYLSTVVNAACSAFQWPAYAASTSLLVPKERYGRANGMIQLSQAVGQIVSPVLAGFLMMKIQIEGIILIDFSTFLFAVLTLLFVQIPRPSVPKAAERESLLQAITFGWTYLTARSGLMGLLILFAILNLLIGFVGGLFAPMMLSFTTPDVLGTVTFVGGIGMLVGGVLMSVWGGPKRRVNGLLGFLVLAGSTFVVAGLRPSAPLIAAAAFGFFFCFPIVSALSDAIWQSKVALDVQGRIFAMRSMVSMSSLPIAYALAGPLADRVFEPLLAVGGPLAESIGPIIGVGQGRGIGLMLIMMGVLTMLAASSAYLHPRIRLVEDELADAITDETFTASNEQEDRRRDWQLLDAAVDSESSTL